MVFSIHAIYTAPSRESVFLGIGWGGRDIRGPYLASTTAELMIGNWALSSKIPSTLELTFSVSNRCQVDGLFVRATGVFGSTQKLLKKNEETILIVPDMFVDPIFDYTSILLETSFGVDDINSGTPWTVDIVALNELRLTR